MTSSDGEGVTPLSEPIESTLKHDPYINGKFIKMMEQEDNADIVRALTVGLAINDPAQPAPPATMKAVDDNANDPQDVVRNQDGDGDTLHAAYNNTKGLIFLKTTPRGFYIPMSKVPDLIRWLQGRLDKHNKAQGDNA